VPKDRKVRLRVVGDGFFFSILLKILDWDSVLGTFGDALSQLRNMPNVLLLYIDILFCIIKYFKYLLAKKYLLVF
jgi:hypothetical protein